MSIPEMDMNPEIARKLLEVGEEFRIEGPFFSYEEIKMGNVNHTYKVNYIRDDGTGMAKIKSFLVQRVNTYAFQHPIELMQNIDRVTEHIREKCPNTKSLHFHHTKHGVNYLLDNDGFWRLSNYVPSVTFDTCDDLNVVRSAGEVFGDFQLMLADFDANSLFYTIPDFHNTRKRYEKLKEDMAADPCNRVAEVREELDWLLSVEDEACRLTDLFEKGELPLRVTHNDTKINNVLFDEKTHEALVVIDLDTVMPGLVGHDFGDAIRFAANFVEEESGVTLEEAFLKEMGWLDLEEDTLRQKCREIGILGEKYVLTCVKNYYRKQGLTVSEDTDSRILLQGGNGSEARTVRLEYPDNATYHQAGWDIRVTDSTINVTTQEYIEIKTHTRKSYVRKQIRLSNEQMKKAIREGAHYHVLVAVYDYSRKEGQEIIPYTGFLENVADGKLKNDGDGYYFLT